MNKFLILVITILIITLVYTFNNDQGMFLFIILIGAVCLYLVDLIKNEVDDVMDKINFVKSEINSVMENVEMVKDKIGIFLPNIK